MNLATVDFRGVKDQFDAANDPAETINPVDVAAANTLLFGLRQSALDTIIAVAEGMDQGLDEDVLPSEYLDGIMMAVVGDENGDAPEQVYAAFSAQMADLLNELGVDDSIIADMFGDNVEAADAAIESMAESVNAALPADGDERDDFERDLVFGMDDGPDGDADEDDVPAFDSAAGPKRKNIETRTKLIPGRKTIKKIDGHTVTYKAQKAVRNGKITVVNKRISGTVVLTSKQKAHMREMGVKANTASAIARRHKHLLKGINAGIYYSKRDKGKRARAAAAALKAAQTQYGKIGGMHG